MATHHSKIVIEAKAAEAEQAQARLERLQIERERLTLEIRAIQADLAQTERSDAVRRHLDSLPPEDRGALIRAAAAYMGHGTGQI